jgi:hypothetical protein
MKLRRWLRSLEPRVLHLLDRKWLSWAKPWIDSHDLLSFQRQPLAVGVAIGLALGVIPTQIEVFLVIALQYCGGDGGRLVQQSVHYFAALHARVLGRRFGVAGLSTLAAV